MEMEKQFTRNLVMRVPRPNGLNALEAPACMAQLIALYKCLRFGWLGLTPQALKISARPDVHHSSLRVSHQPSNGSAGRPMEPDRDSRHDVWQPAPLSRIDGTLARGHSIQHPR